jgi:hypothetical protein
MPMHKNRVWQVGPEDLSPEQLAEKLHEHSWTSCTGFRCGAVLWLNDQTSPDGASEYAIVRLSDAPDLVQIESITASWCSKEELIAYAELYGAGDPGVGRMDTVPTAHVQTFAQHGTCGHCA